jgi:hypothetical protein
MAGKTTNGGAKIETTFFKLSILIFFLLLPHFEKVNQHNQNKLTAVRSGGITLVLPDPSLPGF